MSCRKNKKSVLNLFRRYENKKTILNVAIRFKFKNKKFFINANERTRFKNNKSKNNNKNIIILHESFITTFINFRNYVSFIIEISIIFAKPCCEFTNLSKIENAIITKLNIIVRRTYFI